MQKLFVTSDVHWIFITIYFKATCGQEKTTENDKNDKYEVCFYVILMHKNIAN